MAEAERMNPRERSSSWREGEPSRADAGLRRFDWPDETSVPVCGDCHGSGYVPTLGWHREGAAIRPVTEPVKCPTCRGEGLAPNVQHGGK